MIRPDRGEKDGRSQSIVSTDTSLIPVESIGGHALTIIIAIMTFLVCLSGGGATLIADASRNWIDLVSKEITIQIKPRSNEDTDGIVKKIVDIAKRTPGVVGVHALSQLESEQSLEPWLGQGLDLSQLPVPRLIVVTIDGSHPPDLQTLRAALASTAPQASIDDRQLWVSRLNTLADIAVIIATGILILIIVAMSIAIGFATRGAMAGNHEIIAVLHFVGAADSFIAKQFQAHFTRLGGQGATMGGCAAAIFFLFPKLITIISLDLYKSERAAALVGNFTLGFFGYCFIAVVCLATATLTGLISRLIVLSYLDRVS